MISVYLLLDFARAKKRIEPQGNTLQRNTISRICSASPIFCIFGASTISRIFGADAATDDCAGQCKSTLRGRYR